MTENTVHHSTFTLERTYSADLDRVFAAWSDPVAKAAWFAGPGSSHQLDFRVGGLETAGGSFDGQEVTFTTTYLEIRPNERITYTSTMYSGSTLTTASLTTVEFSAAEDRPEPSTRLVLTEHGAYLDGHERPEWREEGTASQLDALAKTLAKTLAEPRKEGA